MHRDTPLVGLQPDDCINQSPAKVLDYGNIKDFVIPYGHDVMLSVKMHGIYRECKSHAQGRPGSRMDCIEVAGAPNSCHSCLHIRRLPSYRIMA